MTRRPCSYVLYQILSYQHRHLVHTILYSAGTWAVWCQLCPCSTFLSQWFLLILVFRSVSRLRELGHGEYLDLPKSANCVVDECIRYRQLRTRFSRLRLFLMISLEPIGRELLTCTEYKDTYLGGISSIEMGGLNLHASERVSRPLSSSLPASILRSGETLSGQM